MKTLSLFFLNQKEDMIQKCAWRIVRSAEDRIKSLSGPGRGPERLIWATDRLKQIFPNLGADAEDYVRAAFFNMKIEMQILERRI